MNNIRIILAQEANQDALRVSVVFDSGSATHFVSLSDITDHPAIAFDKLDETFKVAFAKLRARVLATYLLRQEVAGGLGYGDVQTITSLVHTKIGAVLTRIAIHFIVVSQQNQIRQEQERASAAIHPGLPQIAAIPLYGIYAGREITEPIEYTAREPASISQSISDGMSAMAAMMRADAERIAMENTATAPDDLFRRRYYTTSSAVGNATWTSED